MYYVTNNVIIQFHLSIKARNIQQIKFLHDKHIPVEFIKITILLLRLSKIPYSTMSTIHHTLNWLASHVTGPEASFLSDSSLHANHANFPKDSPLDSLVISNKLLGSFSTGCRSRNIQCSDRWHVNSSGFPHIRACNRFIASLQVRQVLALVQSTSQNFLFSLGTARPVSLCSFRTISRTSCHTGVSRQLRDFSNRCAFAVNLQSLGALASTGTSARRQ